MFGKSIKLFKLLGFEIKIDFSNLKYSIEPIVIIAVLRVNYTSRQDVKSMCRKQSE